jgi:tetratricopeptide (TPR) repeat protein
MKMLFGCFTAIMGVAVVYAQPQSALALNPSQIATIAEQVSVRIDGQAPGSGVLLARKGQTYYVLTAAHVVATPDEYDVIGPDGQKYRINYSQVKKLSGVDLAIVPFTSTANYQVARLGDSSAVRRGMPSFVAGWPAGGGAIVNSTLIFQQGIISANSQIAQRDGYGLIYTNNTLPGMSGGPVFNPQGEVIGIHGRGQTDQTTPTTNPGVVVKSGFNLGIPINTFLALEPQTGLNLGLRNAQAPVASNANLTADDFFVRASSRYNAGDFQGAIADYSQVVRLDPTNVMAYSNRGMARAYLDDRKGAILDYDQALRLDPNSAITYSRRGLQRSELKDIPGAIADLSQAVKLDPNNAAVYLNRGNFRFDQGDFPGALADFSEAIRLNPSFSMAYTNRGNTHFKMQNPEAAIADYNTSIRLNPRVDDPYFNRGTVFAKTGKFREAIADFQKAADIALTRGDSNTYQEALKRVKELTEKLNAR